MTVLALMFFLALWLGTTAVLAAVLLNDRANQVVRSTVARLVGGGPGTHR